MRHCARRSLSAAGLIAGWVIAISAASINAGAETVQPVGPGYDIEMSRMIPMRDGVELEGWITRPSNHAVKIPTVLTLTQYDIDGGRHGDSAGYYARRGYAFVQVYVRGRGRSGERAPGHSTVFPAMFCEVPAAPAATHISEVRQPARIGAILPMR